METLELGGSERQAIQLAHCLAQNPNYDVKVVGFHTAGQAAQLCERLGLAWRTIWPQPAIASPAGGPKNPIRRFVQTVFRWTTLGYRQLEPRQVRLLRYALRLLRELRRERPTVILSYTILPNVLCGLIWRWTGAAAMVWNQRDTGNVVGWRLAELIAARHVPLLVSNSEHGADYLVNTYHVRRDKIAVIRNGINLGQKDQDRAQWRNALSLGSDTFVVCMLGSITSLKDHATLIHAWHGVSHDWPKREQPPVLLLAGRFGDAQVEVIQLIKSLRLEGSVRLLGHIDDVAGLLGAIDLAVHSSRAEGSPNGVLEAMAAGVPVVASDNAGTRDVLGPEGRVGLVPAGDPQSMAKRILLFAADPELRQAQSRALRSRVENEYSASKMYQESLAQFSKFVHVLTPSNQVS